MSPVLSRPRSPASGQRHRFALAAGAAAAAVVVVLILAVVLTRLGSDRFIANVRVDNPTAYDLTVQIARPGSDSWTDAGTARRGTTSELQQVGDQGQTWVFRFSYAGTQAAELTVPRATLEGDGWRVHVPDSAGAQLTAAGVSPPP